MLTPGFLNRMAGILEAFGQRRFPAIVLERIEKRTRDLSDSEFEAMAEMAIDHCQVAPTTARIVEFANIVRGRREAKAAPTGIGSVAILCSGCDDLGVIEAVPKGEKGIRTLIRCRCASGAEHWSTLPVWTEKADLYFSGSKCPLEWFIPEKNARGLIEYPAIQARMGEWKARVSMAEMYWEHERKAVQS